MNPWITPEAFAQATNRRKEYYGEWLALSDEEKQLRELAETYHTRCETYDRGVCTGRHPETGEAIPITGDELGLVNKHARHARESIIRAGTTLGLTAKQVEQAIRDYCK